MVLTATVESVDAVPDGSRVCHFDELGQRVKEQFPRLVAGDEGAVDGVSADELREYDLVKYTDYYAISLSPS